MRGDLSYLTAYDVDTGSIVYNGVGHRDDYRTSPSPLPQYHCVMMINPIDSALAEQPLPDAAAVIFGQCFARLEKQSHHLAQFDRDRLHRLRMTGKKLRYAAGFFQPLYTERRTARRCESLIRDSERFQDQLGAINDRLVAPCLLAERGIGGQLVAGLAISTRERGKLIKRLRRDLDHVLQHRGFWH